MDWLHQLVRFKYRLLAKSLVFVQRYNQYLRVCS